MQALFKAAVGNQESALKLLTKVLQWAKPYGYIRLFTDMGPMMEILLKSLTPRKKSEQAYVRKILAAFPVDAGQPAEKNIQPRSQTASLVDPLTNREFEILELLGERLTNKEIAAKAHISVGTVEQHLVRVYGKLGVRGRRQAVVKAKELGLLRSQA
jgi:LuxR family transcriptional regulator, maltose regulon positive regulatory protein